MDEKHIKELSATPAAPVPPVDPEDVKAAWELQRDVERRYPGELCAVAGGDISCEPDPTGRAIGYRATMLGILRHVVPEALASWTKEDQLDGAVFRAIAAVPMEWIGEGVREGWPFDVEDFMCRVREA